MGSVGEVVEQSSADVSWEQLEAFKEAYPDFQLEDKLFEPEGGNVMDSYLGKQYSRRRKTTGGSHSG
jgi:transcriptional regulator GlxA family with amidase domain